MMILLQVHEGDCYLLALDLLQQHAATLGAAAIAVTCLMVSFGGGYGGVDNSHMVMVMYMVAMKKLEHSWCCCYRGHLPHGEFWWSLVNTQQPIVIVHGSNGKARAQ